MRRYGEIRVMRTGAQVAAEVLCDFLALLICLGLAALLLLMMGGVG